MDIVFTLSTSAVDMQPEMGIDTNTPDFIAPPDLPAVA